MKDKSTMHVSEFNRIKPKAKAKAAPQKKQQSASEMMNLSRSPAERIIDGLVCKVGEIVSYDRLHIEVTLDGEEYKITVQKVKP